MIAEALVQAARGGDRAALAELMRVQRTTVVRYAMRLCISPEDAEDTVKETLLALARSISGLRHAAALSSWLFRAVRTHCGRLARRSVRHALLEDDLPDLAPGPADRLVDEQLRERLAGVLAALAPEARDVLLRRDLLGETAPVVAEALGISIAAVKSRLHRARNEAKAALLRDLDGARTNS